MNFCSKIIQLITIIIFFAGYANANEIRLGIGTDISPKYEGSSKYEATPSFDANYHFNTMKYGNFDIGVGGLRWETGDTSGFNMAIQGTYINGRDEKIGYFGSKDETLVGMGKLKGSVAAGLELNYKIGMSKIYVSSLTALQNRTYGGEKIKNATTIELGLNGLYSLNDDWAIGYNLASTWATKDYNQAYFGVTRMQADRSKFKEYTPAAGFKDVNILGMVQYKLTDNSSLNFSIGSYYLIGDAAKSPIVENKYGLLSSIGYTYSF